MPRRKKSGKTNTLICPVPGLKNPIELPFEARKLPVCKKCKKIFKTRQLCRVRDGHTAIPWNTTYICFTLDDSCIVDGKFTQAQGDNFIAEMIPDDVPPLPYITDLDKLGPDPPICRMCKEKNYTRYHCRTSHCHKQLPWGTSYAVLKRVPSTDDNDSIDEGTSVPNLESPDTTESQTYGKSVYPKHSHEDGYARYSTKRSLSNGIEDGFNVKKSRTGHRAFGYEEDITHYSECKAFVLIIQEEKISLHWLSTKARNCDEDNVSDIKLSASSDTQLHFASDSEEHANTQGCNHETNCQNFQYPKEAYPSISSRRDSESRQSSPFQAANVDMNSLEPMPYNPIASHGYRSNDYHSHQSIYMAYPYAGGDPQFHYHQSYSQSHPTYCYRQPPSPLSRYGSPDRQHYENPVSGTPHDAYSYADYCYANSRSHYREESAANDSVCPNSYYPHDSDQWKREIPSNASGFQQEVVEWNEDFDRKKSEKSSNTEDRHQNRHINNNHNQHRLFKWDQNEELSRVRGSKGMQVEDVTSDLVPNKHGDNEALKISNITESFLSE